MTAYAFRYDLRDSQCDAGVLKWINEKSPGHLVIKHSPDEDTKRDHWHALIWSDKKEQALRVDFRKANPEVTGNKAYSLTVIKKKTDENPVEAYERYMCHGEFEGDAVKVISAQGAKYTEEFFKELNAAFWQNRKKYKKKGEERAEAPNAVNELLKIVNDAGIKDREEIALKLVRMCLHWRKPINTFYARNVVNTVWTLVNGEEAERELAREIAGKL